MPSPIAVLSADWHCRRHIWQKRPLLSGDAYFAVNQIADLAISNHLPVIAAGDIFDSYKPDSESANLVAIALSRLNEHDLPVYFVQGDHEHQPVPWLLSLGANAKWLHDRITSFGGLRFFGLDFREPSKVSKALSEVPPVEVLITHQKWRDYLGDTRGDCWMHEVPAVKLLYTGDFHQTDERVITSTTGNSFQAISSGSICLQDVGEKPQKYVAILHDDLSIGWVPLRCRGYHRTNIYTEDQLETFCDIIDACLEPEAGLPEELQQNIICIKHPRALNVYNRVYPLIQGRAHLFLLPQVEEEEVVRIDGEKLEESVQGGLVGCLPLVAVPDTDIYRTAKYLLESPEKVSVLLDRSLQEITEDKHEAVEPVTEG